MPVIAVNLAPPVLAEIRSLVEAGHYSSPEQFLEIAAFNQIALEKGSAPNDVPVVSRKGEFARTGPENATADALQAVEKPGTSGRGARVGSRSRGTREVSARELGEVMRRLSLPKVTEGRPTSAPSTPRPPGERVWGQVNRLFPLKLVCRAILVSAVGKRLWEKLDTIVEHLGKDAAIVGSALERADHAAGRKRDDLLATGLPRRGNTASVMRFLTQFVARTTRAGDIYAGAICHYALAEFDGERLGLTEPGVELARMASPILDANSLDAARATLSEGERSFFVRQVVAFVPGELRDFKVVLQRVSTGHATPEALVEAIRKDFPDDWTPLMVRTHASGIVARLTELHLLARHWEGRNVRYETMKACEDLIRS